MFWWAASSTACAALSAVLMREVASKKGRLHVPLEGERQGNCWLRRGRTVGGITNRGELVVGRVLASWRGWTVVSGWEAMSELTGSRWSMRTACGLAPMGFADCWRESYSTDRRDVVATAACFPLDVTEGLLTEDWQHWRVSDSTSWLQAWIVHATPLAQRAADGVRRGANNGAAAAFNVDTCDAGSLGMRGAARIGAWTDCTTTVRVPMQPIGITPCEVVEFTSDGSVEDAACEAARSAYGWVARDGAANAGWGDFAAMLAGAGTVPGDWWEHTSSRAEAAVLLDAMQAALTLARKDNTLRKAIFSLDNEAVVKQCSTLLGWSALRWLKCTDRDIWRCLALEMKALRGAGILIDVRWIRSHPEGRLAHAAWSRDDVANHMADRWANKAHSLPQVETGYPTPGVWDLAYNGSSITGPLRRSLKAILVKRHLQASLVKSGRVTSAEDVDWTLLQRVVDSAKKEGLTTLVWWTKLLGNILATETVLTKRSHGTPAAVGAATCKLCGKADETSWHMIAECVGCPQVIACREKMVEGVQAALRAGLPAGSDVMLALREMWKVDGEGRLLSWPEVDSTLAEYAVALQAW